jgi:hypothetical protein
MANAYTNIQTVIYISHDIPQKRLKQIRQSVKNRFQDLEFIIKRDDETWVDCQDSVALGVSILEFLMNILDPDFLGEVIASLDQNICADCSAPISQNQFLCTRCGGDKS